MRRADLRRRAFPAPDAGLRGRDRVPHVRELLRQPPPPDRVDGPGEGDVAPVGVDAVDLDADLGRRARGLPGGRADAGDSGEGRVERVEMEVRVVVNRGVHEKDDEGVPVEERPDKLEPAALAPTTKCDFARAPRRTPAARVTAVPWKDGILQ